MSSGKSGTVSPNGVVILCPKYGLYLSSSGCANTALQAGSNSGLVVAITSFVPSSNVNSISLKNSLNSFSSVSACAIVACSFVHHNAGKSFEIISHFLYNFTNSFWTICCVESWIVL